jgi:GT2 family glycosyltransferase
MTLEPPVAQPKTARPAPQGAERLVSIIIVNFNGAGWLKECLTSLASVNYPAREVIVVDNASTDDSLEVLKSFSWARLVRSDRNLGFAGGNNLGLQHCLGEYVLLLNNDTIVPPDFLTPLCAYLNEHSEVGVVQGKMVLPRVQNTLDVCGSFLTAFGLPYHYGYYKPDGPKYRRNYAVFSGKGACLLFRREIIPQVGGFLFDDGFFCYYEESDFCHRVWLAGYEVHFVSNPPVQHFMGGTAGGPHAQFVLRHYLRNMTFSLMSNLSSGSRLRILPLFFTFLFIGCGGSLLRLNWGQAAAHAEALRHCILRYPKIIARRRLVRQFRRRSDREIFRKVLRTPRLEYFLKTFTGALGNYEDEAI